MTQCIHVITQYCNTTRAERAAEYDECFRRNLENPYVAAVHNLVEPQTMVPQLFRSHPKYRETVVDRWLTYADAFAYAGGHLDGQVACLCNLDIFLDAATDWDQAAATVKSGVVLCLSRFEWNADGTFTKDPSLDQLGFANSQDAWIFAAPIDVPRADFEIGTLGCDNAIAERIKASGRVPVNAGSRFRIFHYDRVRGKSIANQHLIHAEERAHRPRRRPEEEGQYLLPDIDTVKSVDRILDFFHVNEVDRYRIICDVMSRLMRIQNP